MKAHLTETRTFLIITGWTYFGIPAQDLTIDHEFGFIFMLFANSTLRFLRHTQLLMSVKQGRMPPLSGETALSKCDGGHEPRANMRQRLPTLEEVGPGGATYNDTTQS